MRINKDDMEEFRKIYYEEFRIYLLEKDAYEIASKLANLYVKLSEKVPSEKNITSSIQNPAE